MPVLSALYQVSLCHPQPVPVFCRSSFSDELRLGRSWEWKIGWTAVHGNQATFRSLMSQETTDIANNSEQLKKKSPTYQLFFPCSSSSIFSSSLFVCLHSHLQRVWFMKKYNKTQAPTINTCTWSSLSHRAVWVSMAESQHRSQPWGGERRSLCFPASEGFSTWQPLLPRAGSVNAVFLAPMLKTPDVIAAAKVLTTKTAAKTIATQM